MTNEQIILNNRVFLMEQGVLKGTGRKFMFNDEDGRREVELPEEIHTFQSWKQLGYMVKKGEHSVARFPIWQKSRKRIEGKEGEDEEKRYEKGGYYYKKVAFFFTKDQVEAIK